MQRMKAHVIEPGADGEILVTEGGTSRWRLAGGGGSSGGVLGSVQHAPATPATYTPTTTMSDVDATNAAVSFTAPDSGTVIVRATCTVSGSGQSGIHLCVREGTTEVSVRNRAWYSTATAQTVITSTWRITGLTPGSVHTYKLAHLRYGVGSTPSTIQAGGSTDWWGPLVMTVEAG